MKKKEEEQEEVASLLTIRNGAVLQRFEDALEQALENVLDPNCDAVSARKVKLELVIKPTEERDTAKITVKVSSVLAAAKNVTTQVYVGRVKGRAVAAEQNPKQLQLFNETNVAEIKLAGAGEKEN